jgi:hypothetical protein
MPRARKKTDRAKSSGDAYQSLFDLVARKGWFALTHQSIAKALHMKLPDFLRQYPDKTSVLTAFFQQVDIQMAEAEVEADAPLKEKLFDLLMRRFDAMQPYRKGLARLLDDMPRYPAHTLLMGIEAAPSLRRSLCLVMELGGVSVGPLFVPIYIGLKLVYLAALRAWKHDESPDLSATMATIDRALDRMIKTLRMDA